MHINWRKPIIKTLLTLSGSKILDNLEYIRRLDKLDENGIRFEQEKKLTALLLNAYEHVPYYRILLPKAGVITKKGKVNLDSFFKIPFLTKDIIRQTGSRLYSDDHVKRGSYFNTSGGSTGEPIRILQDKVYSEWNIATKLFYTEKVGKQLGEKEIKLWGSERDLLGNKKDIRKYLKNWLYNRIELNSFLMTDESMHRYVGVINSFKPKHIWAYADSIFHLAKYIERNKLKIHSPNSIITTAGTLENDVKKYLEEVFKTKVYNQYGSREVGDIAAEDGEKIGLRVFSWSQYVEIINEEVYITNLNNFSMPMIRYQIGDTALSHADRIKNVTGRVSDHFKKADGSLIGGGFFRQQFYFKDWVKQFKIVQNTYNKITCWVVLAKPPKNQDEQEIINNIKKVMGKNVNVEFKYTNIIKTSGSGKYLYTESLIK